jgi:3-deoxy-7-phosphoheptulonate synthase
MLAIVGPCSIHDPVAALDYARQLAPVAQELAPHLFVVMRLYFQKPRTTLGWKGLFYDPKFTLNGGDVREGSLLVRRLASEVAEIGLPIATETLDQWMIQYIADLVAWCCIGARTVESQPHRELASGLSTPVGMKNATDGGVCSAIDAIQAANGRHHMYGMDEKDRVTVFPTKGNPYAHVVLRGGVDGENRSFSNFDRTTVKKTVATLEKRKLLSSIVVDAAHNNMTDPVTGEKDFRYQRNVVEQVVEERVAGNRHLVGFMLESNLVEDRQDLPPDGDLSKLVYGQSVTDPCLGFEDTVGVLLRARDSLAKTP